MDDHRRAYQRDVADLLTAIGWRLLRREKHAAPSLLANQLSGDAEYLGDKMVVQDVKDRAVSHHAPFSEREHVVVRTLRGQQRVPDPDDGDDAERDATQRREREVLPPSRTRTGWCVDQNSLRDSW